MKTVFSEIFEGMDMIGALLKRENLMEEDDRVYDLDDELEKRNVRRDEGEIPGV